MDRAFMYLIMYNIIIVPTSPSPMNDTRNIIIIIGTSVGSVILLGLIIAVCVGLIILAIHKSKE